jgi:hypothetical protein
VGATDDAPLTIVLNDKGYASAGEVIAEHVNRGEQVLALDPVFFGSAYPESPNPADWPLLIASSGERPLGLEAAQLAGVAKWLRDNNTGRPVQLDTDGIRTSMVATVAAAVAPGIFSTITSRHAMKTLSYLLDTPVEYRSAPDLFCLDLYKYFDVDSIAGIAEPTKIKEID